MLVEEGRLRRIMNFHIFFSAIDHCFNFPTEAYI